MIVLRRDLGGRGTLGGLDWKVKMVSVDLSSFWPNVLYPISLKRKKRTTATIVIFKILSLVLLPFIWTIGSTRCPRSARAQRWSGIPWISRCKRYCFCALLFGYKDDDCDLYFRAHKCLLNSSSHHRQGANRTLVTSKEGRPPEPSPRGLKH